MRTIILITALFCSSAYAGGYCEDIHDIAKQIMLNRQSGIEITAMYEVATDETGSRNKAMVEIINDAYGYPNFSTKENEIETSKEFAIKWFLACIETQKN